MFSFWILWNNARNLHYIKKFNEKKAIRLADNKQKTKNFLGDRGIPFAESYALIKSNKELAAFDFSALGKKDFVIKPNHGSKGRGIMLVSYLWEEEVEQPIHKGVLSFLSRKGKKTTTVKEKKQIFRVGKKILDEDQLKLHCSDILDGHYSMTSNDTLLIEEKLLPGTGFKDFCHRGLADIRIIVFNLVPVAAMIRIPTEKSWGKANINSGGIGCGIEIGNGILFSTFQKGNIYMKTFPGESKEYQGKKIPFWDDLLFLSSKIQYFVNLGYLALDWVITEDGPKLLEINARAGLEVQKISNVKLGNVLKKIEDLNIQEPQKGVEIAKTLFRRDQKTSKNEKILYLSQPGILRVKGDEITEDFSVKVSVDLNKKLNYISPSLLEKIQEQNQTLYIELPENYVILKQLEFSAAEKLHNEIILGRKVAENYLIKPIKKEVETINILKPEAVIDSELVALHQLDDKIDLLHKRLNLTARLRPKNYLEELDNFITRKGNYAPTFSYNFPEEKRMEQWADELQQLQEQCASGNLKSPLVQLFSEKVEELVIRHQLLSAYMKQDFGAIEKGNTLLRGDFDEELIKLSKEKVREKEDKNLLWDFVSFDYVYEKIEKRLNELGIYGIEIVENSDNLARMSITMGKEVKINISQGISFREGEVEGLIAHEVDTHLTRYLNGKKSWWKIFASGTANYLRDEEGLAIWNAKQKLPEWYESFWIYKKYYLLHEAMHLNFKQLFDLAGIVYPHYSVEGKFKACIRIRKGLIHNSSKLKGYCWKKNKVYLEGYQKVKGSNIGKGVLLGKVKVADLVLIR